MEPKSDYQAKIQNIVKMLPAEKLGEVLNFKEASLIMRKLGGRNDKRNKISLLFV